MKRVTSLIGILLACVLALSGCAAAGGTSDLPSSGPDVRASTGTGWADEFAEARRRATTDFERSALADGRISDAEFAEMENAFATCMRDRNVAFGGFGPGGGYEFKPGSGTTTEEANTIADECSATSGLDTIGSLYFAMQRNPQNLDEAAITAACLVKKKVVPASYSGSDYSRDAPAMAFPFNDGARGEKALRECDLDPLGLLGESKG